MPTLVGSWAGTVRFFGESADYRQSKQTVQVCVKGDTECHPIEPLEILYCNGKCFDDPDTFACQQKLSKCPAN
jgi:hypothetical protein